jgi:hypothetical protein
VNHPNKYVEESRRILGGQSSGSIKQEPLTHSSIAHVIGQDSGIKTEKVTPSSSSQTSSNATNLNYDVTMDDDLDEGVFESMDALGY